LVEFQCVNRLLEGRVVTGTWMISARATPESVKAMTTATAHVACSESRLYGMSIPLSSSVPAPGCPAANPAGYHSFNLPPTVLKSRVFSRQSAAGSDNSVSPDPLTALAGPKTALCLPPVAFSRPAREPEGERAITSSDAGRGLATTPGHEDARRSGIQPAQSKTDGGHAAGRPERGWHSLPGRRGPVLRLSRTAPPDRESSRRIGVHPKVAQTIMRHSTIGLTMDIYTHTLREDERSAVEALPDLEDTGKSEQLATGTNDAAAPTQGDSDLAPSLARGGTVQHSTLHPDAASSGQEWARRDSNPHGGCPPADFKSAASADSATGPEFCPSLYPVSQSPFSPAKQGFSCDSRSDRPSLGNRPESMAVHGIWGFNPPSLRRCAPRSSLHPLLLGGVASSVPVPATHPASGRSGNLVTASASSDSKACVYRSIVSVIVECRMIV
jgi:hypothetical protein